MRALTSIFAIILGAAPAVAADPVRDQLPPGLVLGPAQDRSLDQTAGLLGGRAATAERAPSGGLVGTTLGVVDHVLDKLGIDRDELMDALSEVELSGAGDNWREESSGEVGLSFGITDRFSIGPSFGLRYEEENLAGPREAWSQQLKLGARYNF